MTAAGGLPPRHLALALAIVAIWGTNFAIVRLALDDFPPLLFATLRFAFVLVPAAFFVPRPAIRWRTIGKPSAAGSRLSIFAEAAMNLFSIISKV